MLILLNILNKAKWLISGNFAFAFSQWIILILFSHMAGQEYLGQYSLALAIVSPIFAISNLQLRPLYILDRNGKKNYEYSDFYYLRIFLGILGLIFCLILGLFTENILFPIIFIVSCLKLFEVYSDIVYAYYNAHNQTKLIGKSLLIKGILSVLAVLVGLYFFNFYISLLLYLLIYAIIWQFVDYYYILETQEIKKARKKINLTIVKLALPMGLSLGILTLQTNLPRLFVGYYVGIEIAGVFTVLSYFTVVGSILINSICQYFSPKLVVSWNRNYGEFQKTVTVMIGISILLGVVAIFISYFFGRFTLGLIYGKSYQIYVHELNLVMISGMVIYICTSLGYILTSIGFLKNQFFLFLFTLLCNIMLLYYLVPSYGMIGGVYSIIGTYTLQILVVAIIFIFYVNKKWGCPR